MLSKNFFQDKSEQGNISNKGRRRLGWLSSPSKAESAFTGSRRTRTESLLLGAQLKFPLSEELFPNSTPDSRRSQKRTRFDSNTNYEMMRLHIQARSKRCQSSPFPYRPKSRSAVNRRLHAEGCSLMHFVPDPDDTGRCNLRADADCRRHDSLEVRG